MLHFNDGAGTSPSSQPVLVSSQNSPSFGLSYNPFAEQTVGVPVFTQPRQWTGSDSPALVDVMPPATPTPERRAHYQQVCLLSLGHIFARRIYLFESCYLAVLFYKLDDHVGKLLHAKLEPFVRNQLLIR